MYTRWWFFFSLFFNSFVPISLILLENEYFFCVFHYFFLHSSCTCLSTSPKYTHHRDQPSAYLHTQPQILIDCWSDPGVGGSGRTLLTTSDTWRLIMWEGKHWGKYTKKEENYAENYCCRKIYRFSFAMFVGLSVFL